VDELVLAGPNLQTALEALNNRQQQQIAKEPILTTKTLCQVVTVHFTTADLMPAARPATHLDIPLLIRA
jgi:hypothetical protein